MTSPDDNPAALSQAWSAVLGELEVDLNGPAYETWLRGTRIVSCGDGVAIVEAGSSFACAHLQDRLHLVILRALQKRMAVHDIQFVEPGIVAVTETPATATPAPARKLNLVGAINSAFTLERYFSAQGNLLARSTCTDLITGNPERVSPVVIFAPPGLGKTHLLHGIAHEALAIGKRVACLSGEQLTNRYMDAIRGNSVDAFHAELRQVDLFILDDLQYLAGKKGIQLELQNTMDAISHDGGSVLMASDCPPFELGFIDRLTSRLAAGIVTTIDLFAREERRLFVSEVARRNGHSLPAWAQDRIASAPVTSIRVLQGAINNAIALSRNGMLDLERLDATIGYNAIVAAAPEHRTPKELIEAVARHFSSSFDDVVGRKRDGASTAARAVVVALLRDRGLTQPAIASMIGGRDRTTVRDLAERGQRLLAENPALLQRFSA